MEVKLQLPGYSFQAPTLAAVTDQAVHAVHELYHAGKKEESQRLYVLMVEKLYEAYL